MRFWLLWFHHRWRALGAAALAILAVGLGALLLAGGPALSLRLLGDAGAPRAGTNTTAGTVLPRSGDPNASPEASSDANASVLDAPAPAAAGPQTVAEAQAAWSADLIQQRQQTVLAQLNCARQAQRLPALALDARLTQTASAAWLRMVREPSFSLMQLPGSYRLRSVLPITSDTPSAPTTCAISDFDPASVALTGGATAAGIAVFPPQADWDLPSAVVLVQ
jgi:hypothetical protein